MCDKCGTVKDSEARVQDIPECQFSEGHIREDLSVLKQEHDNLNHRTITHIQKIGEGVV